MGWSVGFKTTELNATDVRLTEVSTFRAGMDFLEAHIVAILDNLGKTDNLREEYVTLLADIQDISHDPGIMDDPDQWEDEDFYGNTIVFWITED